ncbi:MAG: bifunctional demethylmenaquinone methyltransferase/2-methoxy-6-polyprenyl-1,4-benzoquinol methylase UbiE [Pseudomonadota bacterium]
MTRPTDASADAGPDTPNEGRVVERTVAAAEAGLEAGIQADPAAGSGVRPDETGRTTHFGERTVPEGEKEGLVRGVFSSVAARYDLMNDLMSARVHRLWKDAMIDWLAPRPHTRLLDVAGGTGDISFRYLRRVGGMGRPTVCDLTEEMVLEGRRRAEERGLQAPIDWTVGDAMALPFADRTFDYVSIAFGIRNVTRPEQALAEAWRVLRPGGRFLCLEFSKVRVPIMDEIYRVYSDAVIPRMGEIVARDRESYQYLVESIRRFPDQETFAQMLREAGFRQVAVRNLTGGVAALHSGWRV